MATDAAEVGRLRTALRDLVALSTIPAAWVGREPAAIVDGLADTLVGSMRLDFAFVRLRDPVDGAAVDATRGDPWPTFPAWLAAHLAAGGPAQRAVVRDVGGAGAAPCTGLVIPIGLAGDRGLVAVAVDRADFPTETDQLVLSVAANHAATAFQSARLVHERRRAEAQLLQARAELQTILDASPVGMALLDADHTVQRCNRAFERLLGWTADELVGRRVPFPERPAGGWLPLVERLDRGEAFSGVEVHMRRRDGTALDAALACAPLVDDRGRPTGSGLVAAVEDIGDRKRAEESLRRAQAELAHVARVATLGELAASIGHEINQPLAAIVANAAAALNWLRRGEPDLALVREALGDIVTDGHRAGAVIKHIRQLAAKRDPRREPLDLNDVIHDVVPLLRHEVQRHRASLRMALAPALPIAVGDRVQLQQVLINLVVNGIESMASVHDRPREIVIRSGALDGTHVRVAVQDAGLGLDPHHADRLFNAFYTTKPGGMGMGLSISRSIIEGHGGHLWATGNARHGATFHFELPATN